MLKTIRFKLAVGAILLLLIGGVALTTYIRFITLELSRQHYSYTLNILSEILFKNMRQAMNTLDPKVVVATLEDMVERFQHKDIAEMYVYKSKKVEELFGFPSKRKGDQKVEEFLRKNIQTPEVVQRGNIITLYKPLVATNECVACHVNAKPGDVLGVIKISRDISREAQLINPYITYLLGFVIIMSLIAFFVILFALNFFIFTPLGRLQALSQNLAEGEGDLTKRLELNRSDEVGNVAKFFNKFIEKLSNIIIAVKDLAQNLNDQVSHIFKSSYSLSEKVNEGFRAVESLSNVMKSTEKLSQESLEATKLSYQSTISSIDAIRNMLLKLDNILNDFKQISESEKNVSLQVQRLVESANSIKAILEIIKSIADQTNLLSLNAAIEAARAGEMGRGFAVVADEIRKLSEKTHENIGEISKTIEAIVNEISNVGTLVVNNSLKAKSIEEDIMDLTQKVQLVRESIEILLHTSEKVAKYSEEVLKSMDLSMSELESVKAVTDSIKAEAEKLNNLAKDINNLSNMLFDQVNKFKTG